MTDGIRDIAGVPIHYELTGENGSPKVLLLHGWGCDCATMAFIAGSLADRMQVLSIDLPGHGQSGNPPEPWGVPEYADAVATLLHELAFTHCDVIAHSFGARIAIYLAANRPGLFRRMVLTGAAGIPPEKSAAVSRSTAHFRQVKKLANALRKAPALQGLADQLEEAGVQRYGSEDYRKLTPDMRKTFNRILSLDLTDCLPHITAPTLLIWGDGDTATPLWMGQRMEELIPDAGLVVFEGRSHFAFAEESQRFLLIVRRFLLEA